MAYFAGHRYLHRFKKPHVAKMFFQTAVTDAEPGSLLHTAAQAELDKLAGTPD